jgi:hypothetical protein
MPRKRDSSMATRVPYPFSMEDLAFLGVIYESSRPSRDLEVAARSQGWRTYVSKESFPDFVDCFSAEYYCGPPTEPSCFFSGFSGPARAPLCRKPGRCRPNGPTSGTHRRRALVDRLRPANLIGYPKAASNLRIRDCRFHAHRIAILLDVELALLSGVRLPASVHPDQPCKNRN